MRVNRQRLQRVHDAIAVKTMEAIIRNMTEEELVAAYNELSDHLKQPRLRVIGEPERKGYEAL